MPTPTLRPTADQCSCGYDLRGLPESAVVCPECGADRPVLSRLPPRAPQWAVSAAEYAGMLGWTVMLAAIISMTPRVIGLLRGGEREAALMLLGCPGIPALIGCLAVLPWWAVRRRLKEHPTNGDCVFVGVMPWVSLIFVGVPVLAIHFGGP